jgi:hypothetical protein
VTVLPRLHRLAHACCRWTGGQLDTICKTKRRWDSLSAVRPMSSSDDDAYCRLSFTLPRNTWAAQIVPSHPEFSKCETVSTLQMHAIRFEEGSRVSAQRACEV